MKSIKLENGELSVQVNPTAINGVIQPKSKISICIYDHCPILDAESEPVLVVIDITEQQALNIAELFIDAVRADKTPNEKDVENLRESMSKDKNVYIRAGALKEGHSIEVSKTQAKHLVRNFKEDGVFFHSCELPNGKIKLTKTPF